MPRTSADVEKGTIGTNRDQPPVVIGMKEAEGGFFVPNAVTLDVARIGPAAMFGDLLHWHRTGCSSWKARPHHARSSALCEGHSLEAHHFVDHVTDATRQ